MGLEISRPGLEEEIATSCLRSQACSLGCEGIEPLVIHLAYFLTTALQAAVRNTTRGRLETSDLRPEGCIFPQASGLNPQVAQVGFEPTASLGLSQGGLPVAYRAKSISISLLAVSHERNKKARRLTSGL